MEIEGRYLIKFDRRVSGITFIGCARNQIIDKCLKESKSKGLIKQDSQHRLTLILIKMKFKIKISNK